MNHSASESGRLPILFVWPAKTFDAVSSETSCAGVRWQHLNSEWQLMENSDTKHFCRLAALLLAAWLPLTVCAGQGEKLLQRFLNDTRTLSAGFTQTVLSSDGFIMQQSGGRFYLQRPDRFRWDYTEPYQQKIVSDGAKVYIHDIDLQQVTVQKHKHALAGTPMALMQDRMQLKQAYHIEELDQRDGVYRLKLVSRQADGGFQGLVVGVDTTGLRFLQLRDQFEQTTDIVFNDVRINPDLSAELFRFEPPAGADVFGDD